MTWIAAAVVGGAVVSSVVGASASQSAASTEAGAATNAANTTLEATQETNQLQWQIYEQNLANLSPQMQVQQEAESALATGFGLGTPNTGATQLSGGGLATPSGFTGNYAATAGPNFQATSGGTPTATTGGNPAMSTAQGVPVGGNINANTVTGPNANAPFTTAPTNIPTSTIGGIGGVTPTGGPPPTTATVGATSTPGTANLTGVNTSNVNTSSLLTPGASNAQLTAAGASQPSGSLLANFNNQDLNAQLAPSYAFIQGQGQTALSNYNAAHGISGGNATNSETQYAQNTASTYYQQAFQNYLTQQQQNITSLSALAGNGATFGANTAGTSAASGIAGTTMSGVGAMTGYQTGAASATAAGQVGVANALTGAIGTGTSGLLTNQLINNQANNAGAGSNPYNLGGSIPTAPAGSTLTYDQYGNITGSTPSAGAGDGPG